ncbi:MAG: uroporphyrinogen-III C-methyltransferase [Sterolibacterium sp.]|nr:uroporphyrinogen-III C-methyltransferase [Sterolibacterium sp.]
METDSQTPSPPLLPATAVPAVSASLRALQALRRPPVLIATLALLLLGWQWLETRNRLGDLQEELARRLATSDAGSQEARTLARQNQEMLQALTRRTSLAETQLAETKTQQMTLESMYQELSHSRDERLLAEIEQTISTAAQQLQLAGNVSAALIALQSADARLARAALPQLLPLRKLINRDIERLKAVPLADIQGISLKLETVINVADSLPLAFEQRARAEPLVKQRLGVAPMNYWEELGHDLWIEIKQLIRIERIEKSAHGETALLSPGQTFFLRENLKLRLMTARLALLQRDGKVYRDDLQQSQHWLERYFDPREKSVANAITTLKNLSAADLSLEMPTLNETLGSLRNLKLLKEKGK